LDDAVAVLDEELGELLPGEVRIGHHECSCAGGEDRLLFAGLAPDAVVLHQDHKTVRDLTDPDLVLNELSVSGYRSASV